MLVITYNNAFLSLSFELDPTWFKTLSLYLKWIFKAANLHRMCRHAHRNIYIFNFWRMRFSWILSFAEQYKDKKRVDRKGDENNENFNKTGMTRYEVILKERNLPSLEIWWWMRDAKWREWCSIVLPAYIGNYRQNVAKAASMQWKGIAKNTEKRSAVKR